MTTIFFKRLNSVLLLFGITIAAMAQPARQPQFESPKVNADNSVTFRFYAPAAKEVKLNAQFLKMPAAMTKDTAGVWSITTSPIKPDMYPYAFVADGISLADPKNAALFPNEGFQNSLVEITGDAPLVHTIQNVPHGTISIIGIQLSYP